MSARVLFAGGGTGGHLYPALNLGDAVKRADPSAEVFFVGAQRGVESRVLPEKGVQHQLLPMEPIRRARPWENWKLFPAMMGTWSRLRGLFRTFRPDVVVGTGGYASGPAVFYAMLRGVPFALQEQNSFPGFVTRKLAGRARQLHLAFPEARKYLKTGPKTEIFEYGNPIKPPDFAVDRATARARFGLGGGIVCLVTGGSQGARAVNEALLSDLRGVAEGRLEAPPPGFEILWATGTGNFDQVQARLGEAGRPAWVKPMAYIEDMPGALASADFAISRAGAMSLAELCAWGIPAILVPLPTAAANHQHHNAVALADADAALMVPESELGQGRLWRDMMELAKDPARRAELAAKARDRGKPDAADRIAGELLRMVGEKKS
ncbi:undecaprenyldiphospho-muramoylpentapeptide beta-N-acetylglucosaminyltransferase [Longimicrobium sp.]|uniref:undecaprenyldiphospho-muramoylpentapeptide beta-N-acetylglucosaminyltransferase n=1 Tax=Longimicrobium sp. TaxID=2029185 RepID=UPI002C662AF1|nr:undecaprenyldiphospho-muramoylpentapeptide beta-N-acetylglucosaminyltransferase [Longimicrobium sp.]HSU15194.1 undecaprenyldiphospho-muramoylpentapeptide beta-N-acetylglucosaminyltransferase [Longimicrobium sp.]